MSDNYTPTKDTLLNDSAFVARWNAGDAEAIRQLDAVTRAAVTASPGGDKPRPEGQTVLTADQARQLAQQSVDAGGDVAQIKAAIADVDPNWQPDTRTKAERQYAAEFEPGHPEWYSVDTRAFAGEAAHEVEALASTVRQFVASLGFDRSGGSALADEIVKTAATVRGMRHDDRAVWSQNQAAMLGEKRDALIADAAKALTAVPSQLVQFMRQAGALDNANVVFQLADMARARAARG